MPTWIKVFFSRRFSLKKEPNCFYFMKYIFFFFPISTTKWNGSRINRVFMNNVILSAQINTFGSNLKLFLNWQLYISSPSSLHEEIHTVYNFSMFVTVNARIPFFLPTWINCPHQRSRSQNQTRTTTLSSPLKIFWNFSSWRREKSQARYTHSFHSFVSNPVHPRIPLLV